MPLRDLMEVMALVCAALALFLMAFGPPLILVAFLLLLAGALGVASRSLPRE